MNENIFHITWATKYTRKSRYTLKRYRKSQSPVYFDFKMRQEITKYLLEIADEFSIKTLALSVLSDHVHLVVQCDHNKLPAIVTKLKSKSAYYFKNKHKIEQCQEFHLWGRKYNKSVILSERRFMNTINYVEKNHIKHCLPRVVMGDACVAKFQTSGLGNSGFSPS